MSDSQENLLSRKFLEPGCLIHEVPEKGKLFWGTGRDFYDKLNQIYIDLGTEKNDVDKDIRGKSSSNASKINHILGNISQYRKQTIVLNERFIAIAREIKEWKIRGYDFVEKEYLPPSINIPDIPAKEYIFEYCDYDKWPNWQPIHGFFSFDSLREAQHRLNEFIQACSLEIMKARSDINNMDSIRKALEEIDRLFQSMIEFYEGFLDELEFAFSMVRYSSYQHDIFYFSSKHDKIDLRLFPKHHLEALRMCDSMARILCQMSKRQYLQRDSQTGDESARDKASSSAETSKSQSATSHFDRVRLLFALDTRDIRNKDRLNVCFTGLQKKQQL